MEGESKSSRQDSDGVVTQYIVWPDMNQIVWKLSTKQTVIQTNHKRINKWKGQITDTLTSKEKFRQSGVTRPALHKINFGRLWIMNG